MPTLQPSHVRTSSQVLFLFFLQGVGDLANGCKFQSKKFSHNIGEPNVDNARTGYPWLIQVVEGEYCVNTESACRYQRQHTLPRHVLSS